MSNVTPTHIVDKNGKHTPVRKKINVDAPDLRELPTVTSPSPSATGFVRMNADYVRIPEGFAPDDANVAYNFIGERLDGGDYGTDPIGARADYAEVTEEGIAYGMNINDEHLGEVFAGRKRNGESDDEYTHRKIEAAADNTGVIREYLEETYGADVGEGNGEDSSTIEFYVEYEDSNPRMSSLEWMGERAERETKLLQFSNDYLYGNNIQRGLAEKAGYHFELTDAPDRQFGDGFWVKDGK